MQTLNAKQQETRCCCCCCCLYGRLWDVVLALEEWNGRAPICSTCATPMHARIEVYVNITFTWSLDLFIVLVHLFIAIWSLKQVKLHALSGLYGQRTYQHNEQYVLIDFLFFFCIGIYSFQFCFFFLPFCFLVLHTNIVHLVGAFVLFLPVCVRIWNVVHALIHADLRTHTKDRFGVLKVRFHLLCVFCFVTL